MYQGHLSNEENLILDQKSKNAHQIPSTNKPLEFIRHQASRLATKISSLHDIFCQEVESLKSKLHTASNVTDTLQHYVVHRKRSLWLWVEDRTLLNKLGHIFRTHVRRTVSNNDLSTLQQQQHNHIHSKDMTEEGTEINSSIHRYYHVFQKGEIPKLISDYVPKLLVIDETFTQGNWVVSVIKL